MRPAGRLLPETLVAEHALLPPLCFPPRCAGPPPFVVTAWSSRLGAPPPLPPREEAITCADGGIRPPFTWSSADVRRLGAAMTPGGIEAFLV